MDVVVGGHRIPKGTLILWSAHLAGRTALNDVPRPSGMVVNRPAGGAPMRVSARA